MVDKEVPREPLDPVQTDAGGSCSSCLILGLHVCFVDFDFGLPD